MLSIEGIEPTPKNIEECLSLFEQFCLGERKLNPEKFRELNNELSICAVLIIGKHRFQNNDNRRNLIWIGLDNREHNLGNADDINVMRDFPGFHATRTSSLGHDNVLQTNFIDNPNGNGSICEVIMKDGSRSIGPNYRMALRNASLKMQIKQKFNTVSLSNIWNGIWGNA